MNTKNDDRRVRKTKKALRKGLSELLLKKNIKDISVRELTDYVDIHRGTFYLHYRDIYDLYAQIEAETAQEVKGILERYTPEEVATLQKIMLVQDQGEQQVYGKTGTGFGETGWFVGFTQENGQKTYFAVSKMHPRLDGLV